MLAKLKESSFSVIPIVILVVVLTYTIAPIPSWNLILFLISAFTIIMGITLFNLGVDMSLIPIGEQIGSTLVKTRKLPLIVILTFFIGVFITIAEPDLIVLAGQINGVPDAVIIISVSLGVGLALVGAFLRILFQFPLSYILISCYILAFILSGFTGNDFLSVPFTGIAFTINISSISSVLSKICIQAEENLKLGSEDMTYTSKEPYHLIVTIVNSGFFDQVMETAKKAGASGGTVVHARGLGSKEAKKYLGITIQPEKDLVLILTPKEKKLAIMESIMHEVGLNTAGTGICFSLPVDNAIGVGAIIDNFDEI